METQNLHFGDRITVNTTLKRVFTTRSSHTTLVNKWKLWKEKAVPSRKAIFLGYRTLSNGIVEWRDEIGNYFYPKEHFKAALVVFNERENPVYAPLHGIVIAK